MAEPLRAAVLTVSDGVTHGTRVDESGDVAERMLIEAGFAVVERHAVPDDRPVIEAAIRRLASAAAVVLTTGGTGFGPRDVTPEATAAVLDREAPGIAEVMRAAGLAHTPMAALSRGRAGTVGEALVINLPGSPRGVSESLEAVLPLVPHAAGLAAGATGAHPTGHATEEPGVAEDGGTTPWVEVKAVKVVAGSPPCEVGASMRIDPRGPVRGTLGCAEFDAAAVDAAAAAAATGIPGTAVFRHDLGDIEVFIEPHVAPRSVLVVSATDVARLVRSHLSAAGFHVVLAESRRERLAAGDRPSVDGATAVDLTAYRAVVFTDHDAPGLTDDVAAALRAGVGFVGVMGSRRHVAHYVDELRAMGFTDGDLARIRSPLGLDIGGKDPGSVALSIAAAVVAGVNGRDGGWLDR